MKKYLNQIDRMEQSLGIDDTNQNWLVNKLNDGIIQVTSITAGNTPQDSQHLTQDEFKSFEQRVGSDRLIIARWES